MSLRSLFRSLPCFLALALPATGWAADEKAGSGAWLTDYRKAQEQARNEKKLLVLDFTGSDWCGWCMKLKREVFSKTEFGDYAAKNLVLVEVDFPRTKKQSAELQKQNEDLARKFQIQGYPTIVVLNSEGKVLGELGYMEGGAKAFISELEKLRSATPAS